MLLAYAALAAPPDDAALRLAQAYAPIMKVREQQHPPCDTGAEQYDPTSVDAVLGNPTVTLQRDVPGKGLQGVKRAPTAPDIAGLGPDYYLNLRGDPLGDTCQTSRTAATARGWGATRRSARCGRSARRRCCCRTRPPTRARSRG